MIGVDTGGTFTDAVTAGGDIAKVPSTPEDPAAAVIQAALALGGAGDVLHHGTTVATNALLERRGARVALVTNHGFEDVVEIGRQDRPSLYDPFVDRPLPLVPRELRLGIDGRLRPDGAELEALDLAALAIPADAEAIAVALLHSDLSDAHERAVGGALIAQGYDVSLSVDVSPEVREVERTLTTVVNAYLRPVCRPYLDRLADGAGEVLVMTSAGGLVPLDVASALPVALLLSGPAGGVLAAAAAAVANGEPDVISFDMGGTSTDVCLIQGGRPAAAAERSVAGIPMRVPSLDVHTIGAGGGSIARIDPGGALVVGPRSAGAVPGPPCYGRGGLEPTVTDADLVLGRIPTGHPFPGLGALDVHLARSALERAGVGAQGVVDVVDAAMVQALRAVSVERGVDPRSLALVAFGGAGPLHACALADALGMRRVIVPARAGVLSAVGMLAAPRSRELVRSWPAPSSLDGVDAALRALAAEARALVGGGTVTTALDVRYAGQSHELTVPAVEAFAAEHRRRNGYDRPGAPVEVVALRARAAVASPVSLASLPVVPRAGASGPAVLAEPDCTVWVPGGWRADVGEAGALVLRRVRS